MLKHCNKWKKKVFSTVGSQAFHHHLIHPVGLVVQEVDTAEDLAIPGVDLGEVTPGVVLEGVTPGVVLVQVGATPEDHPMKQNTALEDQPLRVDHTIHPHQVPHPHLRLHQHHLMVEVLEEAATLMKLMKVNWEEKLM